MNTNNLIHTIIDENLAAGFDDVHISKLVAEEADPVGWSEALRGVSFESDPEGWREAQAKAGAKYLPIIRERRAVLENGPQDVISG